MVAAEVYRHSDGAYLECQDMFRLSGIFRNVSIFALPKVHIRDFFAQANPVDQRDWALNIDHAKPGTVDGDWRLQVDVDVRNLFPATESWTAARFPWPCMTLPETGRTCQAQGCAI